MIKNASKNPKIAVMGLGYVGLPLALALAKNYDVVGFDISVQRVKTLKQGRDINNESSNADIKNSRCKFSSTPQELKSCDVFIVTVPTPVDRGNSPDLTAVKSVSETIGQLMKKGAIVVYESTVYPGVTEDICGPILEKTSGLRCGRDFFLGYSPERINPGDKVHTIETIVKIVAGQTPAVTQQLVAIYGSINDGKIFVAKDIKTAEAAKAIENAQRDINIAFVNEVALIANKLNLSALDILEAANTKWNFLPFMPGLVGGHCIGVDPYYLAQCAREVGHIPDVILSGRRINDSMGREFANIIQDRLIGIHGQPKPAKILVLGFTFKENVSDTRNTKVNDLVQALKRLSHDVHVHDTMADPTEVKHEYGLNLSKSMGSGYDAIILAVPHKEYQALAVKNIDKLLKSKGLIFDLKGTWKQHGFRKGISYHKI